MMGFFDVVRVMKRRNIGPMAGLTRLGKWGWWDVGWLVRVRELCVGSSFSLSLFLSCFLEVFLIICRSCPGRGEVIRKGVRSDLQ
jgi:hypothetical protein